MSETPIGDWQALTGPSGAALAVAGDYVAAARLDSLSVWRNGELLVNAAAGSATPGRPRFVPTGEQPEQVCWGTLIVDLTTATWRSLDALAKAVTPAAAPRTARGRAASSPRPTDFAWSTDGSIVLVSRQETGTPASLSASATLFSPAGEPVAELWHGLDAGPVAGLVSPGWAIVGARQPAVFSHQGDRLAVLDGTTPPRRIEADDAARRVLTVEASTLRLWDTRSWEPIAAAPGPWSGGAISADGEFVLALDYDGQLLVLDQALNRVVGLEVPGPPDGIAVGERLVAIAAGGRVYCAPWRG
jgi:hypothetical protein